jgi:hypothetical protein
MFHMCGRPLSHSRFGSRRDALTPLKSLPASGYSTRLTGSPSQDGAFIHVILAAIHRVKIIQ